MVDTGLTPEAKVAFFDFLPFYSFGSNYNHLVDEVPPSKKSRFSRVPNVKHIRGASTRKIRGKKKKFGPPNNFEGFSDKSQFLEKKTAKNRVYPSQKDSKAYWKDLVGDFDLPFKGKPTKDSQRNRKTRAGPKLDSRIEPISQAIPDVTPNSDFDNLEFNIGRVKTEFNWTHFVADFTITIFVYSKTNCMEVTRWALAPISCKDLPNWGIIWNLLNFEFANWVRSTLTDPMEKSLQRLKTKLPKLNSYWLPMMLAMIMIFSSMVPIASANTHTEFMSGKANFSSGWKIFLYFLIGYVFFGVALENLLETLNTNWTFPKMRFIKNFKTFCSKVKSKGLAQGFGLRSAYSNCMAYNKFHYGHSNYFNHCTKWGLNIIDCLTKKKVRMVILLLTFCCFSNSILRPAEASPLDSLKEGHVFEHLGTTILGASTLTSVNIYRPCDQLMFVDLLEQVVVQHRDICNSNILTDIENSNIVHNVSNKFILLQGDFTLTEGRKACHDLGTNIVTVKNSQQYKDLYAFMAFWGITETFAGLKFDYEIMEPIFEDDASLAEHIFFKEVFDTNDEKLVSWQTIVDKIDSPSKYHRYTYFTYYRSTHLKLKAQFESNNYQSWKQVGKTRKLSTICSKPSMSNDAQKAIHVWKEECLRINDGLHKVWQTEYQQVQEILPSNVPKDSPLRLPNLMEFNKEFSSPNQRFFEKTDFLNMNFKEKIQKLIAEDSVPLNDQCTALMQSFTSDNLIKRQKRETVFSKDILDKQNNTVNELVTTTDFVTNELEEESHDRSKRALTLLAGLGILAGKGLASIVFSIAGWAATEALGLKYGSRSYDGHKSDLQIDEVIPYMMNSSLVDKSIYEKPILISKIMSTERIVHQNAQRIIDYLDDSRNELLDIVFKHNHRSTIHEFMKPSQYKKFAAEIYNLYGVNLPNNMKYLKTQVVVTDNSYLVAFIIPLNIRDYKHDIYRIHSLGQFNDNQKFIPKRKTDYVAVSITNEPRYTILDSFEAENCISEPICVSEGPSYLSDVAECGVSAFFEQPDSCQYEQAVDNSPDIVTLQNTSYYSVNPLKPVDLSISCFSIERRGAGNYHKLRLAGMGDFTLDLSCSARYDSMTIRSAVTNYYSPIMNNNDSPFEDHPYVSTSGSHFLPDFSFDLKTLSPAKIYEKYFFTIIIILICIGVIACCFTPGVFLCIRYCRTNALLGLVTKYSPSDFKKLDNYRVKKERNSDIETGSEDKQNDPMPLVRAGRSQVRTTLPRATNCSPKKVRFVKPPGPSDRLVAKFNEVSADYSDKENTRPINGNQGPQTNERLFKALREIPMNKM